MKRCTKPADIVKRKAIERDMVTFVFGYRIDEFYTKKAYVGPRKDSQGHTDFDELKQTPIRDCDKRM